MKKRLRRYVFHVGRITLHVSRWTLYVSAAVVVLLAIAFTIARYTLPMIEGIKPDLEQYLSSRSGHQVRIESLHAYWEGLHPGAEVTGLQVFAADGARPAIRLSKVRISLALLPLLWGGLEINNLLIVQPSLALERLADGRFRISGFHPLQDGSRAEDAKFVAWLFRQNRLEIENGEFQWFDHREMGQAVHLARVNMSLQNSGDRHRLGFSAEFPPQMCRACSMILDITGNPITSSAWGGDIYLRAAEMNIEALPLIAREKFPADFRGNFNAQLWTEWERGRPTSIKGNVRVAGLRLPVPGWDSPLAIRSAGGDLSWKANNGGWRLDVANPMIGLTGPAWSAEHLRMMYQPQESRVEVRHIDLGDVTGFAAVVKKNLMTGSNKSPAPSNPWLDYWLTASPEGGIDNFDLRLIGKASAPEDFALETDVSAVAAQPYRKYPGVQGLSGHLSLSRHTGELRLDAGDVKASFPEIFREPLAARRVSGDISWERFSDHWQVNGADLNMVSDDGRGKGNLNLRIPLDKSISPHLKLRVDFQDGNGAHAARYYPVSHLRPATLAWMERSFVDGVITEGYLIYDGPIHDFPFRRQTGTFELRGHVRHGIYRFLPGWEPIKQAEVDVAINGPEVLVTGHGKIGNLDTNQVVVRSLEENDGLHVVHVSGKISGALDETLNILRNVETDPGKARWLDYIPSGMRGEGTGILSLDLTIPLGETHSVGIDGEYRFLKSTLLFPDTGVAADGIEGRVSFTQDGIRKGGLRARFLGGPIALAAGMEKGQLLIHAQGAIAAEGLSPMVGPQIASRIAGQVDWSSSWRWDREKETGDLQAQAELKNLKLSLPAPLNRPDGLSEEKLIIRTESASPGGIHLDLEAGNLMHGKLALARDESGWNLTGGRIGFGESVVAAPKTQGLHVSARLDEINLDQWWPWMGGGTTGVPEWLTHVSAEIRSLEMFDRKFGDMRVDFFRNRDVWSGTLNGNALAGNVKFSGKGTSARFDLDLARLILPDRQHERRDVEVDPRRLPHVELRSKLFQLKNKSLGALDFMAVPVDSGWRIERFKLTRADMKLNVNGDWRFAGNRHESEFDIVFNSSDLGKTMEAFEAPDQVAGGEVSVKTHLSWPGSPANPQLATLSGSVELSAKKGRFLQVKSGAGRLFGLLDLSAIGRYLTLDFSPVFGKGFIYDRINGNVSIERGNAYTHNFSIRGPATQIDVGGRVGLAAEDYDLVIELQPKVSDTLTLASWGVWGPQVAAVVLAVQKIFKKQIAAGTRVTYVVKGPWDKPAITKLVKGDAGKSSAAPSNADDATTER